MVQVLESTMVVPRETTQNHRLWLSNLDLMVIRNAYTPTVYFYQPDTNRGIFSVEILKDSLAKVLVPFYPFAGRLAVDTNGRYEINCNGKGALLVVARADYRLDKFSDFEPSPEASKLFVPCFESDSESDPPLLMFQITMLKCGGMVLGTALHHVVADGRSSFHFIRTWASIARGDTPAVPQQFHDRTLLRARAPPTVRFDHPEYFPKSIPTKEPKPFVINVLQLSKEQILFLKAEASSGRDRPLSTFCAASAHVWKCVCMSQGLEPDTDVRVLMPIDIRARVSPPLPENYFGNAYVRISAIAKASEIMTGSISVGAEKIMGAIGQVDDEYTRSVIDGLELADMKKRGVSTKNGVPDSDLWIVSWLGMSMYDADFGWGSPQFMARTQMNSSGVVVLSNNPGKDTGISVVIALEPEKMERFKMFFYEVADKKN